MLDLDALCAFVAGLSFVPYADNRGNSLLVQAVSPQGPIQCVMAPEPEREGWVRLYVLVIKTGSGQIPPGYIEWFFERSARLGPASPVVLSGGLWLKISLPLTLGDARQQARLEWMFASLLRLIGEFSSGDFLFHDWEGPEVEGAALVDRQTLMGWIQAAGIEASWVEEKHCIMLERPDGDLQTALQYLPDMNPWGFSLSAGLLRTRDDHWAVSQMESALDIGVDFHVGRIDLVAGSHIALFAELPGALLDEADALDLLRAFWRDVDVAREAMHIPGNGEVGQ